MENKKDRKKNKKKNRKEGKSDTYSLDGKERKKKIERVMKRKRKNIYAE